MGSSSNLDTYVWWENTAADGSAWTVRDIDSDSGIPVFIVTGDIDGDGDEDVIAADKFDGPIYWWENRLALTPATFATRKIIEQSLTQPRSVITADLGHDGDIDVLITILDQDGVLWSTNQGDGNVWDQSILSVAFDGALDAQAADIDGDGDLDVVGAAYNSGKVSWFEDFVGTGCANCWQPEASIGTGISGARSVVLGDVDRDGDIDVIAGSVLDGKILWYENTAGDGSSWISHTVHAGSLDEIFWVDAADFDGDGDLDIVAAFGQGRDPNTIDNEARWYENTAGDGSAWTERNVADNSAPVFAVMAADMDGDGDADVLGSVSNNGDILWWENALGTGLFWVPHTVESDFDTVRGIYAADMDRDGDLDVVAAGQGTSNTVAWWENTNHSGTAWSKHVVDNEVGGARSVSVADLNKDGAPDIVATAGNDGMVLWWENLQDIDPDTDNDGTPDSIDTDDDNDGLSDTAETNTYMTYPLDADSDDDGLTDGAEVNTHHTDPLATDSDLDGLTDSDEVARGSNPNSRDSDGDGVLDGDEVAQGRSPTFDESLIMIILDSALD
ncbi:MAG: VCBS repeat-containing protein [Gammaproteobacteria bacterium]|nr:VCBS repeat-containing protein [Gammaproteobacteria bacterium]